MSWSIVYFNALLLMLTTVVYVCVPSLFRCSLRRHLLLDFPALPCVLLVSVGFSCLCLFRSGVVVVAVPVACVVLVYSHRTSVTDPLRLQMFIAYRHR